MHKIITSLLVLLPFLGWHCMTWANHPEEKAKIKRFALIVGANDGGPDRIPLKYAVSDAVSFSKVLQDMGGVASDDRILLRDPKKKDFFSALRKLRGWIINARPRHGKIESIFYYSGHSDEYHILLGKEKISYKELRNEIKSMDADVRIAILDSCASGAFTRLKGGKMRSPFLLDSAFDMKGYAFMSSSSANEASQESDRLRGSFFTHNLVSGLRGAADTINDGRITLNETYQYAYQRTLAQTEKTMSGPQHPNYNIRMAGTGDVVITDIRGSSTVLTIPKDMAGKIFIHNADNVLVVELNKPRDRKMVIGLDEGKYRVINISVNEGKIFESKVVLRKGKKVELNIQEFKETKRIVTALRGGKKYRPRYQGFKGRPIKTNISMPTGFTINKGEITIGIGPIGYGITDKIQIGTNIFLFLLQVYNVDLKTSFIKTYKKSFALGCKLHNFNMDVTGVETKFTSFSPYAAFSTKVSRNTFLHMGGQYSFFSGSEAVEDATAGITSWGTSMALGIEHSVSHKTKFLFESGYDFTFKGPRIGGAILFGWKKFRLKLGVNFFKPKGTKMLALPVVSLWWRFQG